MVALLERWRNPSPATAAASGVDRANRFIVILVALQRLSYLLPALLSIGTGAYHSSALNTALVAIAIAWNVGLFWSVFRNHGWFPPAVPWLDVLFAAGLTVVVAVNAGAEHDNSAVNWSARMAQAAAALAGAAIARVALAAAAVSLLLVAQVAGMTLAGGQGFLWCLGCLNGLIWFAVIIGFATRYLRRQGATVDRLASERLAAQTEQARYAARLQHFRALHDTVLTTLAAIARGGLDHRTEQVRDRCAREADFVRRLMTADGDGRMGTLGDRLDHVVADAGALGLRVHYQPDEAPDGEVPDEVVDAIGGAAQEALNNVLRHAGVRTAWLTVSTQDGGLVVRVVDRGAGFTPGADGFGLTWSVAERMRAVGGLSRVSSAPGDGTCVELVWPAP